MADKKEQNRVLYLDIIKVIACFLVIVNHTNSKIFLARAPSLTWFASLAYFFVSKPAVPLFIMTSGAVLLGKEESSCKTLQRVLRILAVLLAFSFFYYFFVTHDWSYFSFSSLAGFFKDVINAPVTNAYWYLYLYLGLLLMLPIYRKAIKSFSYKEYKYIFLLSVIVIGIAPIITYYLPQIRLSGDVYVPFLNNYVAMFLTGYYIHTFSKPSTKKAAGAAILFLSCIFVEVVSTYNIYLSSNNDYLFYDNRNFAPITLGAVSLFYLVRHFCSGRRFPPSLQNAIRILGSCTFGIYLLSDFFIKKLLPVDNVLSQHIHPLISILIFELAVFFAGFVTTYLLRKIPYLNRFI